MTNLDLPNALVNVFTVEGLFSMLTISVYCDSRMSSVVKVSVGMLLI